MALRRHLVPTMPFCSIGRVRGVFRLGAVVGVVGLLCLSLSAQTTSQCTAAGTTAALVASTGLAEKVGNIVLSCTGGNPGGSVIGQLFVSLNTNITNSLDVDGNPQNISITSTGSAVTATPAILTSSTTLQISNFSYVVPTPNSIPVYISISGIRAAVALIQNGPGTVVTASLFGIGFTLQGSLVNVAIGGTAFLSSVQNNGVFCFGSPMPATTDFPSFIAVGTTSSAVRVTEAVAGAFAVQDPTATNGVRIIVQLSGYPAGTQLFAPNELVGNSGSIPTSGGEFGTTVAGGSYVPSANQLLLSLVTGTDKSGAGGTLLYPAPVAAGAFTGMTQLTVSNGSAYAVYEVVDRSPFVPQSVQVPIFEVNAPYNCSSLPPSTISVMEAPLSSVSVATHTDPIPRYTPTPLGSDCLQVGDCNGVYFPSLSITTAPITLTGASLGAVQNGSISVLNSGGSVLSYTTSITYQSGTGWLTVTPSSGNDAINATLAVVANPAALQPGTYSATVTVNAGAAGTASVPVTFTVGPPGVTIQGIVSAASFQIGAIAPGSYVALFGLNLGGANVGVTFNNLQATIVYDSAGQINLIVPAALTGANANAVVTVNGQVSNSFNVALAANVPGIFTPGILNSNSSVNASSNPAVRGTFVQVYLTGLAIPVAAGSVTVTMAGQSGIIPSFAGAQGTLAALDQVNVTIPAGLAFTGSSVPLSVCVTTVPAQPVCSNAVSLYVQ